MGGTVALLGLTDQHGRPAVVDGRVQLLLLTRDMKGGDLVREALADADQTRLDARGAVYVADIAGMPAMVSRLLAVPRMRRRPYRVFLDRDGTKTRDVPSVAGTVTAVFLDDLRVTRVAQLATAAEVRAALEPPSAR